MKNRKFINEVLQFKKIAGLLREDDNFDLSHNPLNRRRSKKQKEDIKAIAYGLEEGDSLYNLLEHITRVYPEYVERIEQYNDMEQEIIDRAFEDLDED